MTTNWKLSQKFSLYRNYGLKYLYKTDFNAYKFVFTNPNPPRVIKKICFKEHESIVWSIENWKYLFRTRNTLLFFEYNSFTEKYCVVVTDDQQQSCNTTFVLLSFWGFSFEKVYAAFPYRPCIVSTSIRLLL